MMTLRRAWTQVRDAVIVTVIVVVAALAAPAGAQDTTPDRSGTPEAAPDSAPVDKPAPGPAPDTARDHKPAPPPAPEAAPKRKPTPASAQAAAPERKPASGPAPARAQKKGDPEHIRGRITSVEGASISVQTGDGKTVRLGFSEKHTTVLSLSKASFNDVIFGTYVGAVSEKLGDDIHSPIRRDSLSWLHKGYELRIIDEDLRGIAVGHVQWDLTPTSVMTHGWVDDVDDRVLSIKYGPTDYEETDVEVPPDAPVLRMSRGDKSLIKPGARVLVGAKRGAGGKYAARFIFVGKDGIVPPL